MVGVARQAGQLLCTGGLAADGDGGRADGGMGGAALIVAKVSNFGKTQGNF